MMIAHIRKSIEKSRTVSALCNYIGIRRLYSKHVGLHKYILRSKRFEERKLTSQLIKDCHAIEKGLSLKEPRRGFGQEKIHSMLNLVQHYIKAGYNKNHPSLRMVADTLNAYIKFQKTLEYKNEYISDQAEKLSRIINNNSNESFGGTIHLTNHDISGLDKKGLERIAFTRHSIRNFSEAEVNMTDLEDAVRIAIQAPSACNRQPTRIYVIEKSESDCLVSHLQGVGGFENSADKYLIITSDMSAFAINEMHQWVVSSGIFIGYLSLALHACGIAACIVQRSIFKTKSNTEIARYYHIPEEEQIICVVCIGRYANEFNVPVSKRYRVEDVLVKYHKG